MPGLHIDLFSLSWHSLSVNKIHMIFDLQLRLYRQFIYKKKISPLHPCACLLFFSLHSLFGFHSFSFNTLLLMLWSAKCCYYNIVFFSLFFLFFSAHSATSLRFRYIHLCWGCCVHAYLQYRERHCIWVINVILWT